MSRILRAEIRQTKPFSSDQEAVFVSLLRTADHLLWGELQVLKPAGLTFPLYNVLRILEGAGVAGLSCTEIAERMVTRDSDITRLLDRLERRGLADRVRHQKDRRVVITRIAGAGQDLLEQLAEPIAAVHRTQLAHVSGKKLAALGELLDEVRRTLVK